MPRVKSLKGRLILLIAGVATVVLVLGFAVVITLNIKRLKEDELRNKMLAAQLVSEYCVTPLAFDNPQGANEVLHQLDPMPEVTAARLYRLNGKVFAAYSKPGASLGPALLDFDKAPTHTFTEDALLVCVPVFYDGKKYGTLVLKSSTEGMDDEIHQAIFSMLVILLSMLAVSLAMASYYQRGISGPVRKLAQAMERLPESGGFDVRLSGGKLPHELSLLFNGFNRMAEQLRRRARQEKQTEIILKNEKLRAEKADQLKTAFLANMSHEIRTPMNAIIGFSNLLNDEISDQEREEAIHMINSNGQTLMQLIDDILDISKIESGQLSIKKDTCNMGQLMTDVYRSHSDLLQAPSKSNVLLKREPLPGDVPELVQCDKTRVKQMLSNLVNNAIKFTHSGSVRFGVKMAGEGRLLQFYVADTGIGLKKESKDLVFERFNKAGLDKNKVYRGAGLGLAICKSLAELQGGDIDFESEYGKGSTFFFRIPFEPAQRGKNAKKTAPPASNFYWQGRTFLVAEDEDTNFRYLHTLLGKTHAQVVRAHNGYEAIHKASTLPGLDLILMDIKMPDMNGLEAARIIKEQAPAVRIIAQTAYSSPGVFDGYDIYFDGVLVKPIRADALLAIMAKFLE